jgi:hypothetical protein
MMQKTVSHGAEALQAPYHRLQSKIAAALQMLTMVLRDVALVPAPHHQILQHRIVASPNSREARAQLKAVNSSLHFGKTPRTMTFSATLMRLSLGVEKA